MTPRAGDLMLGCGYISHYSEYVLSSTLSIYSTLIANVLRNYDAAFLYHCWFSFIRAQSCELLTRICDLNSDFAIWIKSWSPFCDQKYPTSPTYFFFLHRDHFTYIGFNLQKIVIKMADLSKQHGLSVSNQKRDVKTVVKQKSLFCYYQDILHLVRFHSDYLQCTVWEDNKCSQQNKIWCLFESKNC